MNRISKFLISPLFFIASAVLAGGGGYVNPVAMPSFDGFYAGVNIGATQAIFGHNIVTTYVGADGNISQLESNDKTQFAAVASLEAGYGQEFNRLYIGGIVFATFGNQNAATTLTILSSSPNPGSFLNSTLNMHIKNAFGIAFKPGYLLGPDIMVFAELGVAGSSLRFEEVANGTFFADSNVINRQNGSKTLAGFLLGAGVEKKVTQNLSVNAKYRYIGYGNINGLAFAAAGNATLTTNNVIKDQSNTWLVGLDYYFNNV